MADFRVPPLVRTGAGCARNTGQILAERGYRGALVVTDPIVAGSPAVRAVLDGVRRAGLALAIHEGITSEPTVEMVETALEAFRLSGADVVIGIGGGSPMDAAKAVAVLARSPGPLPLYEGVDKVPGKRVPLVCIATTAGTGSEVTRYVAVTDEQRNRKMLITSWQLLPDVAVADPELTLDLPPGPTVSTGVDALTHAIEAYVSRRRQPLTDTLALSAIRRIGRALPRAYRAPGDGEARSAMSLAALEAGIAFCNASVALVHGMARPLGAYFGVPHGLANAVLLARVSAFTAPAAPERYREIAVALGQPVAGATPEAGARAAVEAIERLCADLAVPSLSALGVAADRFDAVVESMAADAVASGSPVNNPRDATAEEIAALYRACH
ncbi:MAG: iron-containing alcohol dehydrogenase [Chloroflexi bacterium]|nr:iron-containing alcohol dehydrogenase [Chloroflexota bacterium]